jgi:hypothetical protein
MVIFAFTSIEALALAMSARYALGPRHHVHGFALSETSKPLGRTW